MSLKLLSPEELQHFQHQLDGYAPAQEAIATLQHHNGDLESSMEELMVAAAGTAVYGEERQTLKAVFLKNLRQEICSDESLLSKVEEYNKSPTKAVLLTGMIVYVIDLVTLPINPAMGDARWHQRHHHRPLAAEAGYPHLLRLHGTAGCPVTIGG